MLPRATGIYARTLCQDFKAQNFCICKRNFGSRSSFKYMMGFGCTNNRHGSLGNSPCNAHLRARCTMFLAYFLHGCCQYLYLIKHRIVLLTTITACWQWVFSVVLRTFLREHLAPKPCMPRTLYRFPCNNPAHHHALMSDRAD